jgi:sec-independent protein translocase protein TatB
MFDVGFMELVLVSVIGLLVLGPQRLPKVAAEIGKWVGRARRTATQLRRQLEREIELSELETPPPPRPPATPPAPPTPQPTDPSAASAEPVAASAEPAPAEPSAVAAEPRAEPEPTIAPPAQRAEESDTADRPGVARAWGARDRVDSPDKSQSR